MPTTTTTKTDKMGIVEKDGKQKRKSSGPSKQELKDKVAQYEKAADLGMTGEKMAKVSDALFRGVEALSGLPFTKTDPEMKKGFDDGLAMCANAYVGPHLGKWAPLIQLGTFAAFITQDALAKRALELKKKAKSGQSES